MGACRVADRLASQPGRRSLPPVHFKCACHAHLRPLPMPPRKLPPAGAPPPEYALVDQRVRDACLTRCVPLRVRARSRLRAASDARTPPPQQPACAAPAAGSWPRGARRVRADAAEHGRLCAREGGAPAAARERAVSVERGRARGGAQSGAGRRRAAGKRAVLLHGGAQSRGGVRHHGEVQPGARRVLLPGACPRAACAPDVLRSPNKRASAHA